MTQQEFKLSEIVEGKEVSPQELIPVEYIKMELEPFS